MNYCGDFLSLQPRTIRPFQKGAFEIINMQRPIQAIYSGGLGEIRFSSIGITELKFGVTEAISLKYVVSGTENYVLNGQHFHMEQNQMLIFGEGYDYLAYTFQNRVNEGFCIDLAPDFLADARRDLMGENVLFRLDQAGIPVQVHTPGVTIHRLMQQISSDMEGNGQLLLEEVLNKLIYEYLNQEKQYDQHLRAVPALNLVSKKEVFRRLLIARDYLHSNTTENLQLDQIASVAGLSKFYLQRLFSKVFGRSPARYLEELKMKSALGLLEKGHQSISEISFSLGYNDPAYFSRRFKKFFGYSPVKYNQDSKSQDSTSRF